MLHEKKIRNQDNIRKNQNAKLEKELVEGQLQELEAKIMTLQGELVSKDQEIKIAQLEVKKVNEKNSILTEQNQKAKLDVSNLVYRLRGVLRY